MKKSYFFLTAALTVIFLSSCVVDPPTTPQSAPEIPPAEVFTLSTEEISETSSDTTTALTTGVTYRNWAHAGINLLVWNTVIVLKTGIPWAAFGRALNETPVFIGNATFEWTYQHQAHPNLGGDLYDIRLTGQYLNNSQEVEWVMTASKVGGFQEFEWYRGIVSTDHTSASIILNHQPNNPESCLRIDYERNPATNDASIRYTNIDPTNSDMGAYIEHRVQSTEDFNRAYDVLTKPNDPRTFLEIQWNEPTREGRVKHEKRFNNTDWHCWDVNQIDVDCN